MLGVDLGGVEAKEHGRGAHDRGDGQETDQCGQCRGAVLVASHADGDTNGEQQAQIVEDRAAGLAQVGSDDVTATPTARVDPITNAQEECCSRQTRNGQHKSATKALDICFHSNLPLRIRAALSSATIPVRVPSHHWIGRSRVCQQRRFNEQWYVTFTI